MKYYLERNNIINSDYNIDFNKLKECFLDTYNYFKARGDFNSAFFGVYFDDNQLEAPTMAPSPEVYFLKHLRDSKIYPIEDYYRRYIQVELFTVIEILHNHIARYDIQILEYERDSVQKEFREHINSILRFYDEGYFINRNGYVLELPNDALLELITSENKEIESDMVTDKLKTAIKMYLHFTSNHEEKRKAINLLADILEPLRKELKVILHAEWEFNESQHDNLIFQIVNKFNIRHNNVVQSYSEDIWFEWMFHYYISLIKTYYRLKKAREL